MAPWAQHTSDTIPSACGAQPGRANAEASATTAAPSCPIPLSPSASALLCSLASPSQSRDLAARA
eukprot:447237-Rhodomonas_salina.3